MDTLIKRDSLGADGLSPLGGERLIVGTKQLKKALARDAVKRMVLARDADPALTEALEAEAQRRGIQTQWVQHMAELGRICRIDVGCAAAAIIRE